MYKALGLPPKPATELTAESGQVSFIASFDLLQQPHLIGLLLCLSPRWSLASTYASHLYTHRLYRQVVVDRRRWWDAIMYTWVINSHDVTYKLLNGDKDTYRIG
jgi:hypothetical protein